MRIEDDGIGIDPQYFDRVCNPLSFVNDGVETVAILDFTGVPSLHQAAGAALARIASAARMLGARTVITGVRPAVARVLAALEIPLADIAFRSTLMSGNSFTIDQSGESARSNR